MAAAPLFAPAILQAATTGAPGWSPDRPLRLIVTYPPGGVTDIVGRIIAQQLGTQLGQTVVVDNRPGAGGNVGTLLAAQAEPDGQTLLFGTSAMFGVNPILYPKSGVDAVRDFVGLGTIGEVANVLSVVPGKVQATNLADFVAEAKRRSLTYGSVGNGSSSHLSAVVFLKQMGIEAVHVPYKGSAPLVAAMLGKEVDFGFDTTATSTAQIRDGSFRPLGVTTARRASALPDVPTLAEAGVKDYELGIWFALFAPSKTPAPAVARLQQAMETTQTEATAKLLRNSYVDPLVVPTAQLQPWMEKGIERWQGIARDAGIRAD